MSRAEGNLLYFLEVVLRVAVQDHFANWNQRVVLLRPDLAHRRDRKKRQRRNKKIVLTSVKVMNS